MGEEAKGSATSTAELNVVQSDPGDGPDKSPRRSADAVGGRGADLDEAKRGADAGTLAGFDAGA